MMRKKWLKILISLIICCIMLFSSSGELAKLAICSMVDDVGAAAEGTSRSYSSDVSDYMKEMSKENLCVRFYEFGDGDCILIKYQSTEILIDAGDSGYQGTLDSLKNDLQRNITDGVLEYFIVTHGDSDHIGGAITRTDKEKQEGESGSGDGDNLSEIPIFGKNNVTQVFSWFNRTSGDQLQTVKGEKCTIGQIIDFDSACKQGAYPLLGGENGNQKTTYALYKETRDKYLKANSNGDKGTKYTPIAKFWGEGVDEQAPPFKEVSFPIGDDKKATLHLLYNEWYFSSNVRDIYRNCMSVCLMVTYGESKVLLTGDLEEVDTTENPKTFYGETKLMEHHPELLKDVTLFKAAHHGSRSSNSEPFIDHITPQYVAIPCLAGGGHKFPSQESLNNFLKYTDKIFITSYYDTAAKQKKTYHGDSIFVLSEEGKVQVNCPYANTDQNIKAADGTFNPITETKWFQENRSSSVHAYVFDSSLPNAAGTKGDCSLVKYGSTDILINCGTADCSNGALSHYADDIARYCVDGVIELLIVTSPLIDAYRELVDYYEGGKCVREGIFSQYEIKQVVDFGDTVKTDVRVNQKSVYNRYLDAVEKEKTERKSIESCAGESLNFAEKFSVEFLRSDTYGTENTSICCLFNFYGKKMLFTGFLMDTGEEYLVKNNNLSNVVFYKASCYGNVNANTKVLMEEIKTKSNLYVAVNGIPKGNSENDNCLKKSTCEDLLNNSKKVCLTERINQNGEYERVYGDIHFTMSQTKGKIDTKSYAMNGSLEKETATFRSFYKTR